MPWLSYRDDDGQCRLSYLWYAPVGMERRSFFRGLLGAVGGFVATYPHIHAGWPGFKNELKSLFAEQSKPPISVTASQVSINKLWRNVQRQLQQSMALHAEEGFDLDDFKIDPSVRYALFGHPEGGYEAHLPVLTDVSPAGQTPATVTYSFPIS